MSRTTLYLVILLLASVTTLADEEPLQSRWDGSIELGGVATSGNTESMSLNAGTNARYKRGKWTHNFGLGVFEASQDGDQTAGQYFAEYKIAYELRPNRYVFGSLRGEKDEFSGYNYSISETVGYGLKIWETDNASLVLEAGVGGRQKKLEDGDQESDAIVRGAAIYNHTISETTDLTEDLLVEAGSTTTQVQSITALKMKIAGNMSMKLSFTIRHNSDPPEDYKNTDTITAVALLYDF